VTKAPPQPGQEAAYVDTPANPKGTPDYWVVNIISPIAYSVLENQTAVATLMATGTPTPTFALSGGADAAKFAITTGGVLTFVAAPNFEIPTDANTDNVYVVNVTATNVNGSSTKTISVTVVDVAGASLRSDRE
jgi:hypothetical protein